METSLHQQLCDLDQSRFLIDYLRSRDFHVGLAGHNPDAIELYARSADVALSREVLSQISVMREPILTVLRAESRRMRWKRRRP